MNKCTIFKKIIDGKISADILYQDKIVTVFNDIIPKAPVHFLVIPNIFIASLNYINEKNRNIIGYMIHIAVKTTKSLNISEKGYRLIINCNQDAGQEIKHLHIHVIGGKKLSNNFS